MALESFALGALLLGCAPAARAQSAAGDAMVAAVPVAPVAGPVAPLGGATGMAAPVSIGAPGLAPSLPLAGLVAAPSLLPAPAIRSAAPAEAAATATAEALPSPEPLQPAAARAAARGAPAAPAAASFGARPVSAARFASAGRVLAALGEVDGLSPAPHGRPGADAGSWFDRSIARAAAWLGGARRPIGPSKPWPRPPEPPAVLARPGLPGSPPAREGGASGDVWEALRGYLEAVLQAPLPAGRLPAAREAAARALRDQPSLPARVAVVQALAREYLLEPGKAKTAEAALEGRPILQEDPLGATDWVTPAGGWLFAGRSARGPEWGTRLWRRTPSGWRKEDLPARARGVVEVGGRPVALTDGGVFVFDGGSWTRASPEIDARAAVVHGDALYVAADRSVLRWRDGRVEARVLSGEHVDGLGIRDGRLYAATWTGLFAWEIDEEGPPLWSRPFAWLGAHAAAFWRRGRATGAQYWAPVLKGTEARWTYDDRGEPASTVDVPLSVKSLVTASGVDYAHAADGVYRREADGSWEKDSPTDEINDIVEAEGRLYATTAFGLHRRDEGGWRLILAQPFSSKLSYRDGVLYLAGAGVRSWPLKRAAQLQGWEDRVLADLARAAERAAAAERSAPAGAVPSDYDDDGGELTGEDGRSVFF